MIVFLGAALLYGPGTLALNASRTISADRVFENTPVTVRLSVTNTGGHLEEVLIEDAIFHPLHVVDGQTSLFTSLAPGETAVLEYVVQGQRGHFAFPDVRVSAADRLGLMQRNTALAAAQEITVLPQVLKLRRVAIRPLRTRAYAGPVPARQGGSGIEFFGVREYQTGDALRWINWKQSARHSRGLFTNEYEQERIADVGLILDARFRSDVHAHNDSLFEYAVQATASLADAFLSDGNRVGLLIYGGFLDWTFPGYGKVQRERILQALARAEPGESLVFESLSYLPTQYFPVRSQIVVVSPLCKDDIVPLVRLRANGYQVLAVSPDPVHFEAGGLPPKAEVALAARVAYVERTLTLRRLQQAGIQVVSWKVDTPFDQTVHASLGRMPHWFRGIGVEA
ncbi:MAG: DUF58 domain-containing protein [Anaerolineae bacterium]|nr:DUF58 domain-containing protein [Anaerolineae bacterium]